MLRRCVLNLSSSGKQRLRQFKPQTPFGLSARRSQSNAPKPGPSPSSTSLLPKILLGVTVVGATVAIADETGLVDFGLRRALERTGSVGSSLNEGKDLNFVSEGEAIPKLEDKAEHSEEGVYVGDANVVNEDEMVTSSLEEDPVKDKEDDIPNVLRDLPLNGEITSDHVEKLDGGVKQEETSSDKSEPEISLQNMDELNSDEPVPSPEGTTDDVKPKVMSESEDSVEKITEAPRSLEAYSLQDENPEIHSNVDPSISPENVSDVKETLNTTSGSSDDNEKPKDDRILIGLIDAIHTAEKRQAESDFRIFEEEKRKLKEEFEKELKDSTMRELMFAEEAAMLGKELDREKAKAAAAIKMIHDKAEQDLRTELQHKEEELQDHLKKAKELAKAERNAAIANEKASQLEKIAEANLHIDALCMAFYARSEEARQSHSVHKLALGALALEDALSNGLPIQGAVDTLRASLTDVKDDTLIELVLSSIPEETLSNGTNTNLLLNQKYDALKGKLRHFSLIPHGGGGLLTHMMAYLASSIKIREEDLSGDGIESVISRVENLLAEGKLSEAADALEDGVSGTEAEGAVQYWARQARNRAIVEQALAVLQSYSTSNGLT